MSAKADEAEADVCCANCGMAGVDDIKLEECDGCDLVLCGSEWCRVVHREQHDQERKKRQAELLHDNKLFREQERSHLGECPLCFLPMPFDAEKSAFYSCCSNSVCNGCVYSHNVKSGSKTCPFCREPLGNDEEWEKRLMIRIKAGDPAALSEMGTKRVNEGDYDTAFEYWTKAAELGDAESHYQLSHLYMSGEGVEKDEEKELYHLEKAAIGGHPDARYNLGCYEGRNGNIERAVKHFIIAATLGFEMSMKMLWAEFRDGNITKEDLDTTLRKHQAAIDEMRSPEREAAEVLRQKPAQRGWKWNGSDFVV